MSDIDFKSAQEIKLFQEDLLRKDLVMLSERSKFYQRLFKENNIDISKIRTIEDLQAVPFTEKKDLIQYNEDFLCCDKSRIADYVTTSGTTGQSMLFALSDNDLNRLALAERKSFLAAGVGPGSIVQLMVTMDRCFIAGLAYYLGLRDLGASVIRVGNSVPELQWDTIRRLRPDTIMCVPSFVLVLLQYAEEHNIDYRNSSVRRIIGIGEAFRDQDFNLSPLGKRIREKWDVQLCAQYCSTEMGTTFSECEYECGGHVHPELIIVEIVDEDGKPVPDGEPGEVVVTTLGVEAMPLLRYRTGDVSVKVVEQCKCGRNTYRLKPLLGRKNHMMKCKGTSFYPPAIYDVLDNVEYVENYVVVVDKSEIGTDKVTVKVGLKYDPDLEVVKDLKARLRARIRVAPDVEIRPKDEISKINYSPKSRKPIKIIDNR